MKHWLGFFLIPLLAGCAIFDDDDVVTACTEIGCVNGLTVSLPTLPQAPFKIELITTRGPNQSITESYECSGGTSCMQQVLFIERTPQSATVRVTTSAGTRETRFQNIQYHENHPNGEGCPPICINATIVAPLPE